MRTDGVQMAREAIAEIRDHVGEAFGRDYLPVAAREYATKAKNAQEAPRVRSARRTWRAPRPRVARYLSPEQRRLYDLVWKRAVASQMQSAELDQTAVDLADASGRHAAAATGRSSPSTATSACTGRTWTTRGWADDENKTLPPMLGGRGAEARRGRGEPAFHPAAAALSPRPRSSSGWRSWDRPALDLRVHPPDPAGPRIRPAGAAAFIPEDRGRLVTAFLTSFFEKYVDSGFTAGLEERLDDISGGRADGRAVMHEFWADFRGAVDATKDLKISDVIDALDEDLGSHFLPGARGRDGPAGLPVCVSERRAAGRLGLRLGRTGAFIGCSNYPECAATTRPLVVPGEGGEAEANEGPRELGRAPSGEVVTLRRGPYGLYVQLGEGGTDAKGKPTKPPPGPPCPAE
jgi:DNA topoisomerase-1